MTSIVYVPKIYLRGDMPYAPTWWPRPPPSSPCKKSWFFMTFSWISFASSWFCGKHTHFGLLEFHVFCKVRVKYHSRFEFLS